MITSQEVFMMHVRDANLLGHEMSTSGSPNTASSECLYCGTNLAYIAITEDECKRSFRSRIIDALNIKE